MAFADVPRLHPVAPVLGQHTEQILAEDLGLGAGEIASLADRGLVTLV
jgi:crotonobetainyl-CoA:carnitine CoA-transferase CaiB-like acyl-CoA transferase